ncbi:hypothetical protein QE370_002429 [Aeromicrobium sp. SORGH_AS981]|nr:hypothetical protein [Aeromicrobium sp. SORGH_AS_0981]
MDLRLRWLRKSGLGGALAQGDWACWCAASAFAGGGLRKGLDRAAGWRGGSGSRAVARVGRKTLRSCVGGPRMLRLLRDPVIDAEAFGLQRTKEESWAPLGVGWAALLPSRGTVHEKEESLPTPAPSAVDLLPHKRWEGWQIHRRRRCGGRTTAQGRERSILRPPPGATRSPRSRTTHRPAARSRPLRSAGRREAAPAQPHPGEKPHRRSLPRAKGDALRTVGGVRSVGGLVPGAAGADGDVERHGELRG